MDYICVCCHKLFQKFIGTGMKTDLFKFGMRFFVCWLNACPFYVVNYQMMEWMQNKKDLYLLKVFFNLIVTLTLISYFTASLKKPKAIP